MEGSGIRRPLGLNHERFASVFRHRAGQEFSTAQIVAMMLDAYPHYREGSLLPNDHGAGCEGACECAGTDDRIFDHIGHGRYRVRGENERHK